MPVGPPNPSCVLGKAGITVVTCRIYHAGAMGSMGPSLRQERSLRERLWQSHGERPGEANYMIPRRLNVVTQHMLLS